MALLTEHASIDEGDARDVIEFWRCVRRINRPGAYAQKIVVDEGEDRLDELAGTILDMPADALADEVMAVLPTGEDNDPDLYSWLCHTLAQVAARAVLPPLFRLGDRAREGEMVAILRNLCNALAA